MPCSNHAVLLKATARHGTAVERRPVGYLPAFGLFWLPRGVRTELQAVIRGNSCTRRERG